MLHIYYPEKVLSEIGVPRNWPGNCERLCYSRNGGAEPVSAGLAVVFCCGRHLRRRLPHLAALRALRVALAQLMVARQSGPSSPDRPAAATASAWRASPAAAAATARPCAELRCAGLCGRAADEIIQPRAAFCIRYGRGVSRHAIAHVAAAARESWCCAERSDPVGVR
jgi:hypothetical protein